MWTKEEFCRQVLQAESSLYCVARSILHNNEDCADAMQEAILRAWTKLDTLRNEQYFKTWLTRIVIRECYRILRRRKREAPWDESLDRLDAAAAEESEAMQELKTLDQKYRLPIVLQIIDGYSAREIGKILGLPETTVRSRLFRGKSMLRKQLEGDMNYGR